MPIIFPVPGIGKGHLPRRRRLATQLMIEAFYRGFIQLGQLTDMSGTGAKTDQVDRFLDLCGMDAERYPAPGRVCLTGVI
ncbi:MAG: hypothetical protein ABFR65_08935 [Pseudomonadota bacterium]